MDDLLDLHRKLLEIQNNIVMPSEKILREYKTILPDFTVLEQISKTYEQTTLYGLRIAESISRDCLALSYHVNPELIEAFQRTNEEHLRAVEKIMPDLQYLSDLEKIATPFIDWLQSINLSLPIGLIGEIKISANDSSRYKKLKKQYLHAMHESKWFPYAGLLANPALMFFVVDIINTSRGASIRRQKRIDKAILSYYTNSEIKKTVQGWSHSDLDNTTKKILKHAVNAFYRGEYVLTIDCLATLWESLISFATKKPISYEKNKKGHDKAKEHLEKLIEENDYDKIFMDYYKDYIFSHCYGPEETIEGVPNRHACAHGWYAKYPNRKAALNAILLTDFILHLEPASD